MGVSKKDKEILKQSPKWSKAETHELIRLYKEYYNDLTSIKSKVDIWEQMALRMYERDPRNYKVRHYVDIKLRIMYLRDNYNKLKSRKYVSGTDAIKWEYFDDLDQIFGRKQAHNDEKDFISEAIVEPMLDDSKSSWTDGEESRLSQTSTSFIFSNHSPNSSGETFRRQSHKRKASESTGNTSDASFEDFQSETDIFSHGDDIQLNTPSLSTGNKVKLKNESKLELILEQQVEVMKSLQKSIERQDEERKLIFNVFEETQKTLRETIANQTTLMKGFFNFIQTQQTISVHNHIGHRNSQENAQLFK
ncbi:uncharacterized protein LOC136043848 [Artemia franciscana]|uniref:Myb/SANT-like DNA-binding domain-containing protein n=1 Tax=Artemia franciscana TaxID=6661 RepID=A0AA88L729_ARTSF|nr:hypothetical protein QYM36_010097 [Artemia franciscana]